MEQRWSRDCLTWVRWAPWRRYKDAEDADGDLPEGVEIAEEVKEDNKTPAPVYIETKNTPPRDFFISKKAASCDCPEKAGPPHRAPVPAVMQVIESGAPDKDPTNRLIKLAPSLQIRTRPGLPFG